METTKLSSTGRVMLPPALCAVHQWKAGLEFSIESTRDGILLRPLQPPVRTTLDDVIGCVGYKGKAYSVTEMDAAITEEARHVCG